MRRQSLHTRGSGKLVNILYSGSLMCSNKLCQTTLTSPCLDSVRERFVTIALQCSEHVLTNVEPMKSNCSIILGLGKIPVTQFYVLFNCI